MDEDEYNKIVQERQRDDFVVDDGQFNLMFVFIVYKLKIRKSDSNVCFFV